MIPKFQINMHEAMGETKKIKIFLIVISTNMGINTKLAQKEN